MTTFLLIRHASHDRPGDTLLGWTPGVHLSEQGRAQAQRLRERLAALPVAAVYSSPLSRAVETAEILAAAWERDVQCSEAFGEIDFGAWSGRRFDDLAADARWGRWNSFRSGAPLPGGGSMLQVQARAVAGLVDLHDRHREQTVAVVSHSDVIKAVIAHYLGVPLDLFGRIEISPASLSVLALHDWGAQVLRLNDTGEV